MSKKIDIKKIFKDKKLLVIIGSVALNLIFIGSILLCDSDAPRRGKQYMHGEWSQHRRNKMFDKNLFKSHMDSMKTHHKNMREILLADELDVVALRAAFNEINTERAKFGTIAENNMIEKFSKMSAKERQKFVKRMFGREKFGRGNGKGFGAKMGKFWKGDRKDDRQYPRRHRKGEGRGQHRGMQNAPVAQGD
jgi:hypothetical protein